MKNVLKNLLGKIGSFLECNYQRIQYYYLMIVLGIIFINSVLVTFGHLKLESASYIFITLGIIGLVIYCIGIATYQQDLNVTDLLIGILFVIGLFSVVNAVVPKMALWGAKTRYEGLFALSTYYILFLLSKNIKDRKMIKHIICWILFLGGLQVVYGMLQTLNYQFHFFSTRVDQEFAYGFVGNTDFMGSLMSLCYGLSLGISMFREKIKYYDIIFVTFFTIGAILTGCMSCLVGIFFINLLILFVAVFNFFKKNRKFAFLCLKRLIIIVFIFLSCYEVCTRYLFHKIDEDVGEMIEQIGDVVIDKKSDVNYGNGRFYIWQNTLKIVPKNLLNGAGIDNFAVAFNNGPLFYYDTRMYYDKAHNEYLQLLVTEGIFALITYLVILFIAFFGDLFKIKKTDNYLLFALLLAFFRYIAQAFFNISITRVAPIFWIVMGLLINYNVGVDEKKLLKTLD